jgi:predicted nucleic acid-binding protein
LCRKAATSWPTGLPERPQVVLDASLLVALVANEPESQSVARQFEAWAAAGAGLHAPRLARYEVANALARKAAHNEFDVTDMPAVWSAIDALRIEYHDPADWTAVAQTALELERRSAFDAAYVALARQLGAELWTVDGPLARNARSRGYAVSLVVREAES